MAADPTAAYRKQQGLAPVTQSSDPKVVGWVVQAAKATGADPAALLATALQESGARTGAVGDQGTSYGPWQFHRGGALGSHSPAWANSYAAALNRAQEFKRLGVHGGVGAAAVQRPADRSLYAQGVDKYLQQARAILAHYTGQPAATTATPKATIPAAPVSSAPVAPALPITSTRSLVEQPDLVGNTLLQSLIDANARNAGIQSIQLPVMRQPAPLPAPATPAKPAATPTPGVAPVTGGTVVPGKPGGGWAGSHNLALAMAAIGKRNGLSIASEKRQRKLTASGNPSDHWVGSKNAYAFDLSNGGTPTPQMDATAAQIAAALGVPNYHGGRILNITKGGYRYQLLWRVAGHYDHVHIGVRKV